MFVHANKRERVTAAPGDSLLAKTLWCEVSVVKADCVQAGATTNCVRREISISGATNRPVW